MVSVFIIIVTISFSSIFFVISLLWYHSTKKNDASFSLPINWPILGTTPSLLSNLHHFIHWLTKLLEQSEGGTILLKGPWMCKMDLLITADPSNVQYIMSKRREDFHKGDDFNEIFDILGDAIFNSDDDKWRYQRKIALSTLMSASFRQLHTKVTNDKIDKGLIPFLERAYDQGLVIDLQLVFESLISDITYMVLVGHDPEALSLSHSFSKGIHEGEEAVFLRHVLPKGVWKLQRSLGIGKERKLSEIKEAFDGFFYGFIEKKREQVMQRIMEDEGTDLVGLYIKKSYDQDERFKSPSIFLRDTFLSFLLAGQDTITSALSWFFWLIIKHPKVERKIREELIRHNINAEGCLDISLLGDPNKLVYLHASLFETLRLYPPVPLNHRTSKHEEVLPSGHRVKPWTKIILATCAIGRMRSVWGEDCEEFKPERWITEQDTIKKEPSHKFFAFNSGPRICIGKEMSMMRLKAVVCKVLCHKYRFQVVEGHPIEPATSVVLHMKHGLKVKVYKFHD